MDVILRVRESRSPKGTTHQRNSMLPLGKRIKLSKVVMIWDKTFFRGCR